MAVARPVRFLGALSIVLVFFLIYQLTRPVTPITLPSRNGDTIDNMERDPLLDCAPQPIQTLIFSQSNFTLQQ
jgi:mannosyltransferase